MNKRWQYNFDNLQISSILDIGANTGQFACNLKEQYPAVNIVCVEPNPYCESKLSRLKSRKQINDYHILGLSNDTGIKQLILPSKKTKSKAGSLYDYVSENDEKIYVNVEFDTADNFFLDKTFDLIKIDTQGHELYVIKGGIDLISRAKYIIIEYQTVSTNFGAPNSFDAVKELVKLGFYIEDILEENHSRYLTAQNSVHLDLLFTKRKSHNLLAIQKYKNYFTGIENG